MVERLGGKMEYMDVETFVEIMGHVIEFQKSLESINELPKEMLYMSMVIEEFCKRHNLKIEEYLENQKQMALGIIEEIGRY